MFEAVQNPPDAEFWTSLLNHKFLGKGENPRQEELDGVLGNYQACKLNLFYGLETDVLGLSRHANSRINARIDCCISGREGNRRNA